MCNKCKWAMYILHCINSHLSLLLPALPCQDSSARPLVLGLLSERHFFPRSISAQPTVPSSSSLGDGYLPHFR